jgi:hypothetical protein
MAAYRFHSRPRAARASVGVHHPAALATVAETCACDALIAAQRMFSAKIIEEIAEGRHTQRSAAA